MTRKSPALDIARVQVSLFEATEAAVALGSQRTVVLLSQPGIGKTTALLAAMHRTLAATHNVVKDPIDAYCFQPEDHAFPVIDRDDGTFGAAINARYGMKLGDDRPIALLIDEVTKAKGPALNALRPVFYDRRIGDRHFPDGSVLCMAGNLDTDGVGDNLPAHVASTLIWLDVRNPTSAEFIERIAPEFACHPAVVGFAEEVPQAFARYDDANELTEGDNPFIFNPVRGRIKGYTCPRSLHAASDILRAADSHDMSHSVVLALLVGALGQAGGREVFSRWTMLDALPRVSQIVTDPSRAPLPGSPAALYQMAWSLAGHLTPKTVDAICTYVQRWPGREPQALFAEMLAKRPQVMILSAPARDLLASLASVMRKVV